MTLRVTSMVFTQKIFFASYVIVRRLKMFGLRLIQVGKPWSSREIIQGSYSWAFHFFSSSQEVSSGWLDQSVEVYNSEEHVYLFTDGAVQLDSGFVVANGVLRDKEGRWIIGFHHFLGKCLVFNAELWGILEGLKLIQSLGYDHVIIHSDSLEAVKDILGSFFTISNSALIRRIHNVMFQEKQWFLQVYPERTKSGCGLFSQTSFDRERKHASL
ncbi:hypothetical protein J1N35_011676 [Gossypium stocksii]|uniref:RNase H type-1 domain-containing protein n=1 Tax=Gossypium stocksii TaxID=47602 RepID=A0A9D4ADG1_9ROSI|nr:hypothetical protein J1N35_011676 [Gossypium stocksii]